MEDLARHIAKDLCTREVPQVLQEVCENRFRSQLFRKDDADVVFETLLELSKASSTYAEAELLRLTSPPKVGAEVTPSQFVWAQILQLLVELNTQLSSSFGIRLLERCLDAPTEMGYAIGHSTVVAQLAGRQPDCIDSVLVNNVIKSVDDSRAIYAIKAAKWLPEWSNVKEAIFGAMLSTVIPKRSEARWLANERGEMKDLLRFAESRRINIPEDVAQSGEVHLVTRTIVESKIKSVLKK